MGDIHNINSSGNESDPLKTLHKYIRVRSEPDAEFVEFDFAIEDPSLFVELVLPRQAFIAFCKTNNVVHMTEEQMNAVDAEAEKWRYGKETLMAKNHNHKNES